MTINNNAMNLANQVLQDLKNCNESLYQFAKNAPSEISRTYYLLGFVHGRDYTKEECELSLTTRNDIEAKNEFTLEDAKFLKSHNGNNPKIIYWNNLIKELENKQ